MKYYSTNKQAPEATLEEAVVKGLASLCSIPLGASPFHPAFKTHGVRTGCLSRRHPQPQRYRPLPFTKAFGERIVFKKRRMRPPKRPTCPPL